MIDQTEMHCAPRGIALALAIMIVFYLGVWMAVRAAWPTPTADCHAMAASVAHPVLLCKARNGQAAPAR